MKKKIFYIFYKHFMLFHGYEFPTEGTKTHAIYVLKWVDSVSSPSLSNSSSIIMRNVLQQESNRICIYILEYTPHILTVKIVSTSFSFRFWHLKVEEPFISEKIALGITMLETWRKKN